MTKDLVAEPIAIDASTFNPVNDRRLLVVSLARGEKGPQDVIGLRSDGNKVLFRAQPADPTAVPNKPGSITVHLEDIFVLAAPAGQEFRKTRQERDVNGRCPVSTILADGRYPLGPDGPEWLRCTARSHEEAAILLAFMKKNAEHILAEKRAEKEAAIARQLEEKRLAYEAKVAGFFAIYELRRLSISKERENELPDGVGLYLFAKKGSEGKLIPPTEDSFHDLQWFKGRFTTIVRPVSPSYAEIQVPEHRDMLVFLLEADAEV